MAKYKPVLHHRKKPDGTKLIMIRITKDRKCSYISTDYSVLEKDWNNKKAEVRATHDMHEVYNNRLKKIIRTCEEVETKALLADHNLVSNKIKEKVKQPEGKETFDKIVSDYIKSLSNIANRTRQRYKDHLKRFTDVFPGIKPLQINKEVIQKFETKLQSSHAENTLHRGIKFLSGVFKKLQEDDVLPPGKNPFKASTLKASKAEMDRLTIGEIKLLWNGKAALDLYLAGRTFLLMYFLGGLRISEVLAIKVKDVLGDRLVFESMKTEKHQGRIIVSQAREIINYFIVGRDLEEYLLPYMTLQKTDPGYEEEMEKMTALLNKYLKRLASEIELNKPISTKWARHAFTQHYKKSGASPFVVRDTLGHSSVTMSENYEQYDNEEIDTAMNQLFTVFFEKN
jgi:integrase/recombinase XerD